MKSFKPKFHFIFISCLLMYLNVAHYALACSSRSLPKPRPINALTTTQVPPTTTPRSTTTTIATSFSRPNITFPTFQCTPTYDAWYCLNDATCFTVKIGNSVMYNCECAIGFMGPRCEYKELDGSYEPKRPRPILEKASIASGATCILLFLLFICLTLYLRFDNKSSKMLYAEYDYSTASYNSCRFCSDRNCCSADYSFNDMKFLLNNDPNNKVSWITQHIDAFPMGFSTRRFN